MLTMLYKPYQKTKFYQNMAPPPFSNLKKYLQNADNYHR
jgi:hypothetical protein